MRARRRFHKLAVPHLAAVYRLARSLAGPDQAEDLTQETFLRAWTHLRVRSEDELPRVALPDSAQCVGQSVAEDPTGASSRGSRRCAHGAVYDWDRQRTESDLSADMQWALDQLPEVYRWSVLLADVEELTYQEISTTLECPVGTVMSRISRGRRMLSRGSCVKNEPPSVAHRSESSRGSVNHHDEL